jgi:hypothetical protein
MKRIRQLATVATSLALLAALPACSDEATIVTTPGSLEPAPQPEGGSAAETPAAAEEPAYILSTMVSTDDGSLGYVIVLDSLEPQQIDLSRAREFSGQTDVWVQGDYVYVSNGEDFTITKFSVDNGSLVEEGQVSFAAYGLSSFGFWLNTFIDSSKAYFLNDTSEYIVWDPSLMVITGSLPLPAPEERPGFRLFTGYSDRSAQIVDGLLYQPFYWTDESFFQFLPESRIIVTDIATGSVVRVIDPPCPGIDYSTRDADSNLYFSSWIYAPGGAAVLDQPATCVFEVPATGEPRVAFDLPSLTEGRQGGVMRYVSNGRALLSVLHDERFPPSDTPSASELTFGANWRFWSYDMAAGTAQPIESIDWNAGAQYSFDIDQRTYTLVAEADYSASTIYDLGTGLSYDVALETPGWATRLFRLR